MKCKQWKQTIPPFQSYKAKATKIEVNGRSKSPCITRDKDEEILREKMASGLFIQIDNLNLNVKQDNDAINRVTLSSPKLVLGNRIIRIIPNEIQTNYTIKGEPLGKMVC